VKLSNCIVLFPKKDSQQSLSDFRLTSLVSCLHKVLLKVLANRLKTFIEKVIFDTQLTFVKGR